MISNRTAPFGFTRVVWPCGVNISLFSNFQERPSLLNFRFQSWRNLSDTKSIHAFADDLRQVIALMGFSDKLFVRRIFSKRGETLKPTDRAECVDAKGFYRYCHYSRCRNGYVGIELAVKRNDFNQSESLRRSIRKSFEVLDLISRGWWLDDGEEEVYLLIDN